MREVGDVCLSSAVEFCAAGARSKSVTIGEGTPGIEDKKKRGCFDQCKFAAGDDHRNGLHTIFLVFLSKHFFFPYTLSNPKLGEPPNLSFNSWKVMRGGLHLGTCCN